MGGLVTHPPPAVRVLLRPLLELLGDLQREDVALAGAPGAVAAHRAALAPEHPHPQRGSLKNTNVAGSVYSAVTCSVELSSLNFSSGGVW